MKNFEEKTFAIPELTGISAKTNEEHLKLYSGYVKNANLVQQKISELKQDPEKNAYILGELSRRFSFEYNGMRNHEIYFASFVGGHQELDQNGPMEEFLNAFKMTALTRGIGWAVLWYDKKDSRLLLSWMDEQHLGQLNECAMILALDMWEHSFVADYQPSGKKNYVEDFFKNLNWQTIEENFAQAQTAHQTA